MKCISMCALQGFNHSCKCNSLITYQHNDLSLHVQAQLEYYKVITTGHPKHFSHNLNKDFHPDTTFAYKNSDTPGVMHRSFKLQNFKIFNSTLKEEDLPQHLIDSIDSVEPYNGVEQISIDEDINDAVIGDTNSVLQINVSEKDIDEISSSAASIEITEEEKTKLAKRQREINTTSSSESTLPPAKKIKRVIMAPPELDEPPARPSQFVVRLVPDIEDVHLFSKEHGHLIHKSVLAQLKKAEDPLVKFEYCDFERGRYKFVCPNLTAKEWAMNIVPNLQDLWKNPKLKAIDCGETPRLIRATAIVDNPPPDTLDFFDDIEFKNDNIDTNNWRPFNKKKIGNKTIFFFGIDEKSVKDLKTIGFKPYFAHSRIKISIEENKRNY